MSLCIHGYELACDECAVAELPESRRLDRVHVEAPAMLELLRDLDARNLMPGPVGNDVVIICGEYRDRLDAIIARIDKED